MQLTQEVNRISLELIEPLCDATKRFFKKCEVNPQDRIVLKMSKDLKHFRVHFFSMYDGIRQRGSYNAVCRFPTRIPECQRLSEGSYHFGASDLTALLISYHWAPEQIVFDDPLSKETYKYLIGNFFAQTNLIKNRDNLVRFSYIDSQDFPLTDYQKKALKCCMNREGFALFMEQGTGKTPVVIARICNEALLKQARGEGPYRVLIVAPKNVRANWANEVKKFATCAGRVTVVRGDKIGRMKCIIEAMQPPREDEAFTMLISSYDGVATTFEAMSAPEYDLCVLDESHYGKNPQTRRWKALSEIRDRCRQRMCLTGTPITNTMLDLYTQFEFLGENWSGFTSHKAFKGFFAKYKAVTIGSGQGQSSYDQLIGVNHIPMLQERLARQSFLIKKSEALPDLPEKVYDIHEVELTSEQIDVYKNIQQQLIAEIQSDLEKATGEKQYLVVQNTLTKMLRLAQVTSGFVGISEIVDDMGNVVQPKSINRFDPNPKVEAVVEVLKNKQPHEKTLIWACWTQDIKTLKARLKLEDIDAVTYYGATSDEERSLAERRFNCDPECRVLIGNPAAGGTGLNLLGYDYSKKYDGLPPTYCNHVGYFSQNWSPTARSQSEDRCHRKGTVCHVQYTDFVVPGTIDEEIRMRVMDKRLSAMRIQDVRQIIERLMIN